MKQSIVMLSHKKLKEVNELTLSAEQLTALDLLRSGENVFLTGGAGSGKSTVVKKFIQEIDLKTFPILASTGASAVLIGGRTFHSFFGIGILEGGVDQTFKKASEDKRVIKRIKSVDGFIIDEISMIPGCALDLAQRLCCHIRNSTLPWGGLRVLAVGDFFQLPPVTKWQEKRDWCFLNSSWLQSNFINYELKTNMRVQEDQSYLTILNEIRLGYVSSEARLLFQNKRLDSELSRKVTRLYPRRDQADFFNQSELAKIPELEEKIPTIFFGEGKFVDLMKKTCPFPETLILKPFCEIMFTQNDPNKRWVNGTRGKIIEIHPQYLTIEKENGRDVKVEKSMMNLLDADGNIVASAINFPIILAYALTIHKSQGATLNHLAVDLERLWEPGQAYVALSRLTSSYGLHLLGWREQSVIVDKQVCSFYKTLSLFRSSNGNNTINSTTW